MRASAVRCSTRAGLGHPLLPARALRCATTCASAASAALLLVSGSNMSGKSTLLRTVGVNVVLALAGAPVRARAAARCRRSRRRDAAHRGFAAGGRLALLRRDHAAAPARRSGRAARSPLLFLLDEILHGTNSHDRRIGAEAIVRGLVDRGAIGLVTTHDLALAEIADALGARATNVHFEDHLEDGA